MDSRFLVKHMAAVDVSKLTENELYMLAQAALDMLTALRPELEKKKAKLISDQFIVKH